MAYLAIHGSGAVNGVSRLHGRVSRRLFESLFPALAASRSAGRARDQWSSYCQAGTRPPPTSFGRRPVAKSAGWGQRTPWIRTFAASPTPGCGNFAPTASQSFIEYARQRLSLQLAASGASAEAVDEALHLFDPNALTLGFARRFAPYKRPNLLLHNPERLLRLLTNPQRPVQLILAGKAHPADQAGQALIQEWIRFIQRPEVRPHVIFLSDYDMLLTEHLVQGVDVWINTPRRPWEACGTSGMKVLVNGGLNLSELDGWWAEAYTPEVGWALGDGQVHDDDPAWDAAEAEQLYDLLEREVIPEFYTRNKQGIPTAWVKRMRESMARLTAQFSANRAVREYTEQCYLPAAAAYLQRAADKGAAGAQVLDWEHTLQEKWGTLRFGEVKVASNAKQHVFVVEVYFGDLDPNSVRVELFADGVNGGEPERQVMKRGKQLTEANGYLYSGQVPAKRPATDYTARLIPQHDGVAVPLEAAHILWQR